MESQPKIDRPRGRFADIPRPLMRRRQVRRRHLRADLVEAHDSSHFGPEGHASGLTSRSSGIPRGGYNFPGTAERAFYAAGQCIQIAARACKRHLKLAC
jgi:hypothetical protein